MEIKIQPIQTSRGKNRNNLYNENIHVLFDLVKKFAQLSQTI